MADSVYDLLIVIDATASMGSYLQGLRAALPDIIRLSLLTDCFARIGIVAYRDYDYKGPKLASWSGWYWVRGPDAADANAAISQDDLVAFAANLQLLGNSDTPEAAKTGLALAYAQMRPEAETLVLLYADAPPHTLRPDAPNHPREQAMLTDPANAVLFGPDAPVFADWVRLARLLRGGDDNTDSPKRKRARVFSFVETNDPEIVSPYLFLSARTGGTCFNFLSIRDGRRVDRPIMDLTLAVLFVWMGVEPAEAAKTAAAQQPEWASCANPATVEVAEYKDAAGLAQPQDEADPALDAFWGMRALSCEYVHSRDSAHVDARDRSKENLRHTAVGPATLAPFVARRAAQPVTASLAQRYAAADDAGAAYRALVATTLRSLLEANPAAIAANAIFGGLWRAVAQDRASPDRDELVALFGRQIDGITDPAARAHLRAWLDASYDYAAEIRAVLDAVPAPARFPCVFLDPTLDFSQQRALDGGDDDDGDAGDDNGTFTRAELLEISRSCNPAILRRLGRALTRLTYVATEHDLPAHVAGRDAVPSDAPGYVPRIPLALATGGDGVDTDNGTYSFWRILLHTIVPGTRLAARPAALLAALSLRMGITPLRDAAIAELRRCRGRWNDITVPETWNVSCLGLLLAADRVAAGEDAGDDDDDDKHVLTAADRRLFTTLIDYHMADRNRATTLTARVGWTPDKTRAPMGPTVRCRLCRLPRSVTMMAPDHVCGLCAAAAADPTVVVPVYDIAADDAATPHTWVECSVRACRAQYIVYCVDDLRVRPKCHACRVAKRSVDAAGDDGDNAGLAVDWVACVRCWNRIIWPPAYRPADFDAAAFCCPACTAADADGGGGFATVVDEPTTADALVAENGLDWLLRNDGGKIADPLSGRSLFQTVSQAGVDGFCDRVAVLPVLTAGAPLPRLALHGKPLHNVAGLLAQLRGWIDARRAERETCSLCFDTFRRAPAGTGRGAGPVLRRACGRRGCHQRICPGCSADWYGLNRRGRVLNIAALYCPFCRRPPTPATVAAAAGSAAGLHLLANLRAAVDAAGKTVYAWCYGCGEARPYAARVCGAAADDDAAAPVERWHCDACQDALDAAEVAAAAAAADAPQPRLVVKNCPGCGAPTEKAGGCNHITCRAPGCTAHWCFQCGEQVAPAAIYEHMNAVHNGFYGGMGGAYEDEVEDDDDDEEDA